MSPGPTFDRVYLALKEQLRSGRHEPGAHLEPAALGEELSASITPVRDALHRLTGERMVDAPRHDGFRVPLVTELVLRQLYAWQADLLRLAVAHRRSGARADMLPRAAADEAGPASAEDHFLALGRASGNRELLAAIVSCCDRLAPARRLEARFIADLEQERDMFGGFVEAGDLAGLRPAIAAYHRRRERIVPQLVAALQRPF